MKTPVVLTHSMPEFLRTQGGSEFRCEDGLLDPGADRDVVVWAAAPQSSPVRVRGPLSVRAVWGGAESCTIGRRTLCVDEDSYLVINGGHEYSTHAHRHETGAALTIFFSSETRRACAPISAQCDLFAEYLRPHDDVVTPCLHGIMKACRRGVACNDWYADQIHKLYARLVSSDDELQRKAVVFAPASLPTRTELFRRVMTATDFVNSNYMSSITLDNIASAAHLSKYHLARLFRALHGVSPAAYLRLKRIRMAERLIERSDADLAEIAERAGFGSRWSMFRELRRRRGMSGQRIRQGALGSSPISSSAASTSL